MVEDAKSHADEDKKRREKVDAKNQAESLLYQARKLLSETGDKIQPGTKEAVEKSISELESVKDGEDLAAVKSATQALTDALQKAGTEAYQQASASQGGTGESQTGQAEGQAEAQNGSSEPVDADFEVVDEDKS
jgi:molecular chaperone DnaK